MTQNPRLMSLDGAPRVFDGCWEKFIWKLLELDRRGAFSLVYFTVKHDVALLYSLLKVIQQIVFYHHQLAFHALKNHGY